MLGNPNKRRAHSKRKLSGPHSWADLAGLVGRAEGGWPLCTRLRAPAPPVWGTVYPPRCTSCNVRLPSATFSSFLLAFHLPFTSLFCGSHSYSLPPSVYTPQPPPPLHSSPSIISPASQPPLLYLQLITLLSSCFSYSLFFFSKKHLSGHRITCYGERGGCRGRCAGQTAWGFQVRFCLM